MSETEININNLDNSQTLDQDQALHIPIPFWYNTDIRLAIPTVAIYDNRVGEDVGEVMDDKMNM